MTPFATLLHRARDILDRVRAGEQIPESHIRWALVQTGDVPGQGLPSTRTEKRVAVPSDGLPGHVLERGEIELHESRGIDTFFGAAT